MCQIYIKMWNLWFTVINYIENWEEYMSTHRNKVHMAMSTHLLFAVLAHVVLGSIPTVLSWHLRFWVHFLEHGNKVVEVSCAVWQMQQYFLILKFK